MFFDKKKNKHEQGIININLKKNNLRKVRTKAC